MKFIYLFQNRFFKFIIVLGFFSLIFPSVNGQIQLPSNFSSVTVSTGWNGIEGFQYDAVGKMYAWEKGGKIWVVDTNGVKSLVLDIGEEVGDWRDHGLNGFALDPNFNTNGYMYLFYVVDRHYLINYGTANYHNTYDEFFNATICRITRYTANPATNFKTIISNSRLILLGETKKTGIPVLQETHSAGSLVFGTDGTLLVSCGEGAYPGQADNGSMTGSYWNQALTDSIITQKENVGAYRSQMINSLSGKILRLDPATGNGVPSNPYYDPANPRDPKSRVWCLGLRNPFRMVLKPNTGSTDPTAADPGVLYIGDVGWTRWEELNVVTQAKQNFGWPIYEGYIYEVSYYPSPAYNKDAPNPLYGTGGCTQQFFSFHDLITNPTLNGVYSYPNSCNSGQQVPSSIPTFVHKRPALDWFHGNEARTGNFTGNLATVIDIDSAGSPVTGPRFGGNASVGGVWYTGNKYPLQYQNKYFHADYGVGWIKTFDFDNSNEPVDVQNFLSNGGAIVFLTVNPKDQYIYYISFPDTIKKIQYNLNVNNPPVAVASQNIVYGGTSFTVNFTGSNSTDPDNLPLTYLWDFGDGTTSTSANPSHLFSTAGSTPLARTVTLTVTDNIGQTSIATLKVYLNDSPPVVNITSFQNGDLYTMAHNSTLPLQASVTHPYYGPNQLYYSWNVYMHHNNHEHPEATDTNKVTSAIISPVGCDGNTYYYRIQLTVRDALGLSTVVQASVYPACNPPVAAFTANATALCSGQQVTFTDQSANLPDTYQWSFPGGNPSSSTLKNPLITYSTVGSYNVSLTVTSTKGTNTLTKNNYIVVGATPTISPAGNIITCSGTPIILTATSGTGYTYQWKKNGSNISNATNSTYSASSTGTYSVFVNSGTGCSGTSAGTVVTVNSTPAATITASGPTTFCSGGSVLLNANTGTGYLYQWKKSSVAINGATASYYTVTTSGSYTVTITNPNDCSKTSSSKTVTVNVIPAQPTGIGVTGGNTKVCPGDTRTYKVTNVTGVTYNWVVPTGGTIQSGQGTNQIVVNYDANFTANGTMSVTGTNSCGTSIPRTSAVSKNTPTTPSVITGTANGVCNLSAVNYSIVPVSGFTYDWSYTVTTASITSGQGTGSITSFYSASFVSGNLSVKSVNGCGTSSARTLTIKAAPAVPSPITGSASVCANQVNVAYSVSNVPAATKYQWTAPAGSHISDGTTTGGTSLTTSSNSVTISFGSTAGNVTCKSGNVCGYSSSATKAVTFNCKEGNFLVNSEAFHKNEFQLRPNPFSNSTLLIIPDEVDLSNTEVIIYDVLGKEVKRVKNITSHLVLIEREQLLPGAYFLQFMAGGMNKFTSRLLIK